MDRLLHTANALVSLAALATAGGPIAATGAGVSGLLSWRAIRAAAPPAPDLAAELARDMSAVLDAHHASEDQRNLIPQMVEAALPDPATIIGTALDADRLIAQMQAALTDREHRLEANLTLFRATLRPAFTHLLNDPDFATTLAPQFMQAMLAGIDGIDQNTRATLEVALDTRKEVRELRDFLPGQFAESLQNLNRASRDQLEALAARFEIAGVYHLSDAALRQELDKRAEDWRALRREIAAIPESLKQLSDLKGAAQAAFDAGRLDEVEELLARVHEVELEEAARSAELRAEIALLRGRVDQAFTLLDSAADSFKAIDPLEPARRRILHYFTLLRDHGLRYGGPGSARGLDLLVPVLSDDLRARDARLWAAGMNWRGVGYQELGSRTGGAEGAALLAEAVTAYRAALEVRTRADHPVDWAMTQNNLGNALLQQGIRTGGRAGAALLAKALTAYSFALELRTRADHPVDWAITQNNLGNALSQQGRRTTGREGPALLAESVAAYRAALEVRTRADHPAAWAMTQNNLGTALQAQGSRTGGPEGAALLGQAVTAYRAALELRTRADHPVDWAMTQENFAILEETRAQHDSCTDPIPHLRAALEHIEAALEVFDPTHMPYDHQKASALREDLRHALDGGL